MEFKIPYKFSKDYDKLYDIICQGNEIVSFVDYKSKIDNTLFICRDVCTVRRLNKYNFQFSARGIGYGGLYGSYNETDGDEKQMFIAICHNLNVDWIEP